MVEIDGCSFVVHWRLSISFVVSSLRVRGYIIPDTSLILFHPHRSRFPTLINKLINNSPKTYAANK